ncbi:hypothetical protein SAMN05216368_102400 [Cryobacterium flavum]|uniref:Uncharacterized protein n=1 Tax=Cryobacterium flavum TaxID=1424659 RepID=A0A5E9FV52_9MICO|nr:MULTISPECIES: hypothetical protein [Cryobacterium]SDM85611.1 hypothetical protein SAMN05216368_102400 [Cryobacterium flavum]
MPETLVFSYTGRDTRGTNVKGRVDVLNSGQAYSLVAPAAASAG